MPRNHLLTLSVFSCYFVADKLRFDGAVTEEDEFVHLDLGDVLLLSILVVVTPVDDLSFDQYFAALGQVLLGDIRHFTPYHEVVPLGIGYLLPFGIAVDLTGGHGKPGHLFTGFKQSDFGGVPQIADQLYFVF